MRKENAPTVGIGVHLNPDGQSAEVGSSGSDGGADGESLFQMFLEGMRRVHAWAQSQGNPLRLPLQRLNLDRARWSLRVEQLDAVAWRA